MQITWVPNHIRQAGRQLLCLADRLKSDPSSHQDVVERVIAELTGVAAQMEGKTQQALVEKADEYRTAGAAATPEGIRALGQVMINIGDKQEKIDRDAAQRYIDKSSPDNEDT